MFKLKTVLLYVCALALLLNACYVAQPEEDLPPVVEVQGSGVLRTIQVAMKTTMQNPKLGMSATTPNGLVASYLYSTSVARTQRKPDKIRVDLPKAMFKDGRSRSAVYRMSTLLKSSAVEGSQANAESELFVFFTDNNQVDTESTAALAGATAMFDTMVPVTPLSDNPFAKMSAEAFEAAATEKGFQITAATGPTTTASQTIQMDGATMEQKLTYEASTGAVVHIESVTKSATGTQSTTSDIKYVDVPGIPGMTVPYEIKGKTVVLGAAASGFGGNLTSDHTVRFNSIKVNSLSTYPKKAKSRRI